MFSVCPFFEEIADTLSGNCLSAPVPEGFQCMSILTTVSENLFHILLDGQGAPEAGSTIDEL